MIDDASAVARALKCGGAEGFAIRGFVLGGEEREEDGVGECEADELARKRDLQVKMCVYVSFDEESAPRKKHQR